MNKEIKDLIEQLNVCSVDDYNFEIYGSEAKILEEYITNLQQENQQLKERNEFLIKRENKLQQIEMMFKNRSVDLEKLSKLLSEGSNE